MSYQVLARKWRPRTFSQLVGQEHVVRALTNALTQQRLHHAYLLTGTRGVGKTTTARIFAKALNCESGVTAEPCGQCTACTEIDSGRFVDLIEVDAASNTQVDNMRELLDNAQYAPTSGRFKVYVIDEVHMLSRNSFNAMLKTLEEPPQHVKFILATTDPQKIPVTVLSRCLQFNLKQLPPVAIARHLQKILELEHIRFDAHALPLLAQSAQGSMRDALSLLDQAIAHGAGAIAEDQVRSMLGVIDRGYLYTILNTLADRDGAAMLVHAEHMLERSISFEGALQELAALLHQVALAQTIPEARPDDSPDRASILELARRFTAEDIQLLYQIALHGRRDLSLAPDEYSGFTMTLMRMLAFVPTSSSPESRQTDPPSTASPLPGHRPTAQKQTPAGEDVKKNSFDGDWPALVKTLKLGGMAKMLAQHCELKRFDGQRLELCVPIQHKVLMDKAYQDKLRQALAEQIGSVTVIIAVGDLTGMTPAQIDSRSRDARQALAVESIEQDPLVRELIEHFDAELLESTIKPIEQAGDTT